MLSFVLTVELPASQPVIAPVSALSKMMVNHAGNDFVGVGKFRGLAHGFIDSLNSAQLCPVESRHEFFDDVLRSGAARVAADNRRVPVYVERMSAPVFYDDRAVSDGNNHVVAADFCRAERLTDANQILAAVRFDDHVAARVIENIFARRPAHRVSSAVQ